MPMLKRPDGEVDYEEFGSGGLEHQRLRVTACLDRHTPGT
jgi:hypothetical protein